MNGGDGCLDLPRPPAETAAWGAAAGGGTSDTHAAQRWGGVGGWEAQRGACAGDATEAGRAARSAIALRAGDDAGVDGSVTDGDGAHPSWAARRAEKRKQVAVARRGRCGNAGGGVSVACVEVTVATWYEGVVHPSGPHAVPLHRALEACD